MLRAHEDDTGSYRQHLITFRQITEKADYTPFIILLIKSDTFGYLYLQGRLSLSTDGANAPWAILGGNLFY